MPSMEIPRTDVFAKESDLTMLMHACVMEYLQEDTRLLSTPIILLTGLSKQILEPWCILEVTSCYYSDTTFIQTYCQCYYWSSIFTALCLSLDRSLNVLPSINLFQLKLFTRKKKIGQKFRLGNFTVAETVQISFSTVEHMVYVKLMTSFVKYSETK